jgi:hypothetical protein
MTEVLPLWVRVCVTWLENDVSKMISEKIYVDLSILVKVSQGIEYNRRSEFYER